MSHAHGDMKRALLVALEANEYADEREAAQGLSTTEPARRISATGYFPTPQARLGATRHALDALARDDLVTRLATEEGNIYWRRSSAKPHRTPSV